MSRPTSGPLGGYDIQVLTVLALSSAIALGQKVPTVVGTWVPDEKTASVFSMASDFRVTFRRDRTVVFAGFGEHGTGRYLIHGNRIDLLLPKTQASPHPHSAVFTIAEGGKALMFLTGTRKAGREVPFRAIREH